MKTIHGRTGLLRFMSAALALFLAALLLAGCGKADKKDSGSGEIGITTPVCELILPDYWGDAVTVEDVSADGQFRIRFSGKVGDAEALLFEISIGQNGTGYPVGSAPDSKGERLPILLDIRAIEPAESWTQEQTDEMNSLQAGVNDLLDQFYSLEGFEKAEN